jgi:hypothetical protein
VWDLRGLRRPNAASIAEKMLFMVAVGRID